MEKKLDNYLLKFGLNIEKNQKKEILKYFNFLIENNKTRNLASIKDKETFFIKNVFDCILIKKLIDNMSGDLIDIGSGNGLPGFIYKIIFPQLNVTLLDAELKKIKFLKELQNYMEIDVNIIYNRAEKVLNKHYKYNYVTAKALVSDPLKWIKWTTSFLKRGGISINYKTPKFKKELKYKKVSSYMKKNMLNYKQEFDYDLYNSYRSIILLEKNKQE
ncbi:MAG: 16S rRNA (guanine(527)-N(7))-methyltransferase RsmG [Candidatus Muiribacteriota bacterium]